MIDLPIYPETPRYAVEVVTPRDRDPGCRDCKLGNDSTNNTCMAAEAMDTYGTSGGEGTLLVVLSAPGHQEDRSGRPLTGKMGSYFRRLLMGWKGTVVIDHAMKCPVGKQKLTPKYYESCRGYLAGVYHEAKPTRVLLVGTEAVNAFMGRGLPLLKMKRDPARGGYIRRGYGHLSTGVPVMIVMSPEGASSGNRFVRAWFEEDMRWAFETNPPRAPLGAVYFNVTTVAMAKEVELEVRVAGGFTGDLESFGHPHNKEHTILTFGVTPLGEAISYIWDESALEDPEIRAPLARILEDPTLPKGGQNWKFDCVHVQTKYGIVVRGTTFDTKLNTRIMQADGDAKLSNLQALVGMFGSKDEASEYVAAGVKELRRLIRKPETPVELFKGMPRWKLDLAIRRIKLADANNIKGVPKAFAYAAIPRNVRSRYCGTDCISTDHVREWQEARKENWHRRVWDGTTGSAHYAITQMEVNGIAASQSAIDKLRDHCDQEIVEHQMALSQHAPTGFNIKSPAQVGKFLFETLRLPNGGMTKTGYKTSVEVLEKLKHPAAAAILGLRKAMKFRSQYASGMEFFMRDDGRIHPTVNIDGTETGRYSCTNPNMFAIPKTITTGGKLARNVYIAPEGRRLINGDYSQIELRVAAFLSGDEVMIDLFKRDVDFHVETAKLIAPIFNTNPDEVDKKHVLRSYAKTVNFAVLYGDTVAGLAAKLGISKAMAGKLQAAILGQFKRLKAWIDESLAFGRRNGYCTTWWDGADYRRRPLWHIADRIDESRETAERSSWNTRCQGTGAEFTSASLGRFQQVIEKAKLPAMQVLTVYDSILLEVDESAVDEVAGHLLDVMTSWNSAGVPLKVDLEVGQSWGELEPLIL